MLLKPPQVESSLVQTWLNFYFLSLSGRVNNYNIILPLSTEKESIEDGFNNRLITSDPGPPLVYGLFKVHKENITMRHLFSSIGLAT